MPRIQHYLRPKEVNGRSPSVWSHGSREWAFLYQDPDLANSLDDIQATHPLLYRRRRRNDP